MDPWLEVFFTVCGFFVLGYILGYIIECIQEWNKKRKATMVQRWKFSIVQTITDARTGLIHYSYDYGPYVVYFPIEDSWILDEPYLDSVPEKTVRDRIFEIGGVESIEVGNVYGITIRGDHR